MQTAPPALSVPAPFHGHMGNRSSKTPPLWFVTDGAVTVGPITTNLLMRGVLAERVPRQCLVRERTWTSFRSLERIREVAALRRAQARGESVIVEPARWKAPAATRPFEDLERDLLRAQDPGEVLISCLTRTMQTTGACVGAVHRRRPPHGGFTTTGVSGPGMTRKLGLELGLTDPAMMLAAEGVGLAEAPRSCGISGRIGDRLGGFPACAGIAMVPVLCAGHLYAVIELGRPDHEFRGADLRSLRAIADLAADRLGIVRNCQGSVRTP